jgi:hypothetical protein
MLHFLSILMGFSFVVLGLVSVWLINLCKGKAYFDFVRVLICALMLIGGTKAGGYIRSSEYFSGDESYAWSYALSIIFFLILAFVYFWISYKPTGLPKSACKEKDGNE